SRPGGRLAAGRGDAVRATGGVVDDRWARDHPSEGTAGPLPDGLERRAPLHPRGAARSRRRALPRAAGAVSPCGPDPDAFAALFLDRRDPMAGWRELSARQAELVGRLLGAAEIHIEAEGTDLHLRVDGRTWVNSDGRRNMSSGEVFTGPHERSANGLLGVALG